MEPRERKWRTLGFLSKVEKSDKWSTFSLYLYVSYCLCPSFFFYTWCLCVSRNISLLSLYCFVTLIYGCCSDLVYYSPSISTSVTETFFFSILISISTKALGKKNSSFFENSIYSSFSVRHGHLRFCLSGCVRHTTLLLMCQVVREKG